MAEKASEAIEASKKIDAQLKEERKREEEKQASEKTAGAAPAQAGVPAAQKPAAEKPAEPKKEEKKKLVLERTFTIPLSKAYRKPGPHRGRIAVSLLKQFVARHAKTGLKQVRVKGEVNSFVLAAGGRNPPKRVRVRVEKDEQGIASVALAK